MGTETFYYPFINKNVYLFVKLNNPLMGTETIFLTIVKCLYHLKIVKLNNPLMGTETNDNPL